MPIIVTNSDPNSIGQTLSRMGEAMFTNQAQREYQRQMAIEKQQENAAAPAGAQAIRDNNPTEVRAQSFLGRRTAPDANGYALGMATDAAHGNINDPTLNVNLLANGKASPVATAQSQEQQSNLGVTAEAAKERNKLVPAIDDKSGQFVVRPQSDLMQPGQYRAAPTQQQLEMGLLFPGMVPGMNGAPAPAQGAASAAQPAAPQSATPSPAQSGGELGEILSPPAQSAAPAPAQPQAPAAPQQPGGQTAPLDPNAAKQIGVGGNLTGEAYLQYLDRVSPAIAAHVRAVHAGNESFPQLYSARTNNPIANMTYLALAQAYPQDLNAHTYSMKQNVYDSFSKTGPNTAGAVITSANKIMPHLQDFVNATLSLGNGQVPTINALRNWANTNFKGQGQQEAALTSQLAVMTELPKMLRGAGVINEQEEKLWQQRLDPNNSVQQTVATAKEGIQLLMKQYDANDSMWRQLVGGEPPLKLSPAALSARHYIEGLNATPNAIRLPPNMTPEQAAKAYPPGTPIILPDGRRGIVPGGQ